MTERKRFRKELLQILKEKGYEASEISSLKTNGEKDGIIFHNKSTFSPIIYIEPYYLSWQKGMQAGDIAKHLIGLLPDAVAGERMLQEIPVLELIHKYPDIRKNLKICMMNRKMNKELLEITPHQTYGDFAAVVYFILPNENFQVMIREELLTKLQIDFEVLFKDAYINMMGEFELWNMEELLYESLADQLRKEEMKEIPADTYIKKMCEGTEIHVMTHRSGMSGAAAICYSRELERVKERLGGDFVMIPASTDELVFIPFKKEIALETINELVRMANQRLEQEERLSDTSYVYLGKEKSLIGSQEYMRKIQSQIEHSKEAHYRSEQYAREEWGNR